MSETNTITLVFDGGYGWHARYSGPHAREIKNLFGTTILPTPFTPKATFDMVRAELATRNPGVEIVRGENVEAA